jgi:hypothetical protein
MVSVIIPPCNCGNFVGEAVESVLVRRIRRQLLVLGPLHSRHGRRVKALTSYGRAPGSPLRPAHPVRS